MLCMVKARKAKRQNIRHARDLRDRTTGELLGEEVDVEDPENPKRKIRVVQRVSPLRRMYHSETIDERAYEAGRRFNEAYAASRMGPRFCGTNAERIMVDVSMRDPEQALAFNLAGEECAAAIRYAGDLGGSLLECVIGQEMSVADWVVQRARMNRWGQSIDPTSAGWVLRQVLAALAGWYRQWDREH
jgi:hypothetical protein